MPHFILVQDFVNHLIEEMGTSICGQCSWSAEPCKYVAAKELGYHTSILSAGRYCFNLFRDVIFYKKDVQVIKRGREWAHEIDPPQIK